MWCESYSRLVNRGLGRGKRVNPSRWQQVGVLEGQQKRDSGSRAKWVKGSGERSRGTQRPGLRQVPSRVPHWRGKSLLGQEQALGLAIQGNLFSLRPQFS